MVCSMVKNRAESADLVPLVFSQYVRFPYKAACIWLLIFGLGLIVSSLTSNVSNKKLNSTASVTINSSDPCAFSGAVEPSGLVVSASSFSGSIVSKQSDDSLAFKNATGGIVATLKNVQAEDGSSSEIYNAAGNLNYVTKPDDDGYKILSAQRELIARVKFKEEKFNIYSSSGDRIYYGKEKKGSIVIRNDAGSNLTWITASNNPPLTQIAPLCLPIDEASRALLYANELVKNGAL